MPRINTQAFYHRAIEKYGCTAEGVHWNSTYSQEQRFAILRELLPADLSAFSLVDVGCGFGDFYVYLARYQAVPRQYIGIDILATMVATARQRTGCDIIQCDVLQDTLPTADYYVCSGAMNTLTRAETVCFIERCFHASQQAFLFNLLRGPDQSPVFNYCEPEEVSAWAQQLGTHAIIKNDYSLEDFTVVLPRTTG